MLQSALLSRSVSLRLPQIHPIWPQILFARDGSLRSDGRKCKVGVGCAACHSFTSHILKGFARRFFTLYQSGLLSYSFEPGQPIRDQISLHHAAISTAPGRKDIHIDSNTATFHIKCLSTEDFNKWMMAFRWIFYAFLSNELLFNSYFYLCRKFIFLGTEARRSASMRLTSRHGSMGASKSGAIAEEMGSVSVTILQLKPKFIVM